jgi:hypothetical protein
MAYLLISVCRLANHERGNAKEKGVNTDKKKLYYASHTDATDYIGGSSCPIANREEVRQNLLEMFFIFPKRVKINSGILLCLRHFFYLLRYFSTIYIPTNFIF